MTVSDRFRAPAASPLEKQSSASIG